jgi:hypothetical protein
MPAASARAADVRGDLPGLNDGSGMNREVHVRFCESLTVQSSWATHPQRALLSIERAIQQGKIRLRWYDRAIESPVFSTALASRYNHFNGIGWSLVTKSSPRYQINQLLASGPPS